jgi:4-amino-4-deoxychorismate lyase
MPELAAADMSARSNACLVNGKPATALDIHDRGIHYGDGVFETIAVCGGAALLWQQHLQRLQLGCQRLGIRAPEKDLLRQEAEHLIRDAGLGVLKIILTRGAGGRGYRYPDSCSATRILGLYPWPDHIHQLWRDGAILGQCRTRLSRQPALAGIKHLNRLEQVLARSEWRDQWHDAVMLDDQGAVIEGTMSNLFAVRDGVVFTPALRECGIAGVMRAQILAHGPALQLDCREIRMDMSELNDADELFLTNSIIGLWPVVKFNGRLQEYIREQKWAIMD